LRGLESVAVRAREREILGLLQPERQSDPGAEVEHLEGLAIFAPMLVQERAVGALVVVGPRLDEDDRSAVSTLALHLGRALDDAALLRELRQTVLREHDAAQEMRRLNDVLADLLADLEPVALSRRIATGCAELLGVEQVALIVTAADRPELSLAAGVGLTESLRRSLERLAGGATGFVRRALEANETIEVEDTRREESWAQLLPDLEAAGLRSAWMVPLLARQGERLGVLAVFGPRPGRPSLVQPELAQRFARQAALALVNSRSQEQELARARQEVLIELARSIPHELAQPLAVVSGYAELIAEGLLEGERERDACREIVAASKDLADLVHRLERVTRYSTREYGPGRRLIDLATATE
jgi:GAF domain-containing protein